MALVKAYRTHGHLAARLDPGLGARRRPRARARTADSAADRGAAAPHPAPLLRVFFRGETLADVLPQLQETYAGTSAFEIEHISDHQERVWLRQAIETGTYRTPLTADEKRRLLIRLTEVGGLRALPPARVPRPEAVLHRGARRTRAHARQRDRARRRGRRARGRDRDGAPRRLNVLAHVLGRPYETILREFEGERRWTLFGPACGIERRRQVPPRRRGRRKTPSGDITVSLAANPSHLEAVDPVVEGLARSEQTD